jgi:hypothetical protein
VQDAHNAFGTLLKMFMICSIPFAMDNNNNNNNNNVDSYSAYNKLALCTLHIIKHNKVTNMINKINT